ncbi:MAG: tyrosine--tRNA ligase [Candidatus Hydrogenedentes bacterium CG07_land_8_20_14_0_80_42_17]|nr:MAG: tyrosine--tRNA ligase [Candidatus Hydrogenedentes bacterium CG07_land_8_20_14_0_80_42_17]
MIANAKKILLRGVDEVIGDLDSKLKEGRPLRIKAGFDPTAPDLHLGHTVLLRKLRQFQDLGHKVFFLIGDFTAMIGDPSGRNETRPPLTREAVLVNAQTYKDQVFKILDPLKTEVVFNSSWLEPLGAAGILKLASYRTVARMLERDDFKERFKNNIEITITEFLYPLLQGYDSVALNADVEIGGSDQRFNLLMGRKLQEIENQPPQVVVMLPLIEGLDGVRKMSKSYGNAIGILENPDNIFGKIMSIPDSLIWRYMILLTSISEDEIEEMKNSAINPRDAKARLAAEIVSMLHDRSAAENASIRFDSIFKRKEKPEEISEIIPLQGEDLPSLLLRAKTVSSKSEARRLIEQGGVRVENDSGWTKITATYSFKRGDVLKVGKKGQFLRIG